MNRPPIGTVIFYRSRPGGPRATYRGTVTADTCSAEDCPTALHVIPDGGGLHHVPLDLALPVLPCPRHNEAPRYDGSTGYHLVSCETCDGFSEDDRPGGFVGSSEVSLAGAVAAWNEYVEGEDVAEVVGGAA